MRLKINFLVFLVGIIFSANLVFADTPIISAFTANSFVNSNAPLSISWVVENAQPSLIKIVCPTGVKLTYTNGSAYTCGSETAIGSAGSGGLDFIATNVSGSAATISVTLTPKDGAGVSYPSLSRTIYVTIGADLEPINSFTISPTLVDDSIDSYKPITFTWTSRGTTGVNLNIACSSSIIASSTSYTQSQIMPCNTPIFATDLGSSASLTLTFNNSRSESSKVRLTFLPAMASGLYDGAHAKVVELTVKPYKAPVAEISTYTAEPMKILSMGSTTLSWQVKNTGGVNVRTVCPGDLTFINYASTTKRESYCGELLFSDALSASSTVSVKVINGIDTARNVAFLLVPQISGGNYDTQSGKSVEVRVEAKSVKALPTQTTGPGVSNGATPAVIPGIGSVNAIINKNPNAYKFMKYLEKGSRGADVTALQNYLKTFPDLYPEGLVTGTFGPATERAIGRFQEKYGIAKKGQVGYGVVGPRTRAKLNE